MKKLMCIVCLLMTGMVLTAQTFEVAPDSAVHNGDAAGHVDGFIQVDGMLDVSGMAAGSLIYFNVALTDIPFNLAGFQFQVQFPAGLINMSTETADWNGGTDVAIMAPGAAISHLPNQQLPATDTGSLVAPSATQNRSGLWTIGVLFTDPAQRLTGNTTTPNAGGTVLRLCFKLANDVAATCLTKSANITVELGSEFSDASDDIFANDSATREQVGFGDFTGTFGWPGALERADANGDGLSGSDALRCARCALFGLDSEFCVWTGNATDGLSVFDYDCDGEIEGSEALILARYALNLRTRTAFGKRASFTNVDDAGSEMVVSYGSAKGAAAGLTLSTQGLRFEEPYINDDAMDAGWTIIHKRGSTGFDFIVMNVGAETDLQIPDVHLAYRRVSEGAGYSIANTMTQRNDTSEYNFIPELVNQREKLNDREDEGKVQRQ